IDWYTALPGPIRPIGELPEEEQARLRAEAERLAADIEGLGSALIEAGGTGERVGRMLTLAVRTPGPEHLHAVGDQPVLVLWAHETEGIAPAPAVPMAAIPAAAPAAPEPAMEPAVLASAPAVPARRGLL